jgi:metal transporter CNNM
MALMSADAMQLKILADAGSDTDKRRARRIMPLVERHHLILVTLLIVDAGAAEALPIFLDRISSPVIAIVISVTAVLFFGEILPSAVCSKWGLAIGANMAWFVWFLIAMTSPVSWPLSKLLDCALGKHSGTFYRRSELKQLLKFHQHEHR